MNSVPTIREDLAQVEVLLGEEDLEPKVRVKLALAKERLKGLLNEARNSEVVQRRKRALVS
jgi:hypothetical protein